MDGKLDGIAMRVPVPDGSTVDLVVELETDVTVDRVNAAVRKAAEVLCTDLQGEKSIYGRQLKMIALMEGGATIGGLGRKLKCSRRTVFRYLNHLEDAGVSINLEGGKYRVDKNVARMLRA